ncbi:MAG: type I-C CRISPR-associated protein Cas5 [Lentisphaerae bacterium]|nr:type I-C CRISPR-associated protein Cas5 [Lentisphaerota bacterium]
MRNQVEFLVRGRYALFTDPITRVGGEKSTYQLPTYQALKGVIESVYWKPTITWIIDRVRILNLIRTEAKHIRPINFSSDGNTLSIYTYLSEPAYQVQAHFIFNENRPEFEKDRNENKHYTIAKRMIERGGRRDIFLGTRECQAYVEPCKFGSGDGFYDNTGILDFGLMLHGIDYPDETGREMLAVRFWRPRMENGVVIFPCPSDCDVALRRDVRPMKKKNFMDFSGLEEPALQTLIKEEEALELDSGTLRDL